MRRARSLLLVNCIASGLLTALPWTGVLIGDPARGAAGPGAPVMLVAMVLFHTAWIAGVLFGLSMIELLGIRFISARRRWRLTRGAAWHVGGHASVGWTLGPVLAVLGLAAYYILSRFLDVVPRGSVRLALGRAFDLGFVGWDLMVQVAIIGGSYFAGLLAFESLVYVGVRECKFANATDAAGIAPSAAGA